MILKYLGLPYDIHNEVGVNCWGLYSLVKKQEQGIDVLMFSAISSSVKSIASAFESEINLDRHGHYKVAYPKDFDLALLTRRRKRITEYHCGVMIGGKILHAKGSGGSGQVWCEDLSAFEGWQVEYWRHD